MKTNCPHCKTDHNVTDEEIIEFIRITPSFQKKVASLLGKMTGGRTKLDAAGRRERALKAVQAREAKRNGKL